MTTREPGGAPGAELIRRLLVEGGADRWDAVTEALLHYAARRDHLRQTIGPALARGAWVLCDRFADSTLAYQGYGHGLGAEAIAPLHDLVAGNLRPDLTLILDLPVATGLARAAARRDTENRYEAMDIAFHERVRRGFLAIAAAEPDRCVVVDADRAVDEVASDILAAVQDRLPVP